MKTIWKVKLNLSKTVVSLPKYAEVLSVQMQEGAICAWLEVDTNIPAVEKAFKVYGTGHEIKGEPRHYCGTVQDGPLVWHIFELL